MELNENQGDGERIEVRIETETVIQGAPLLTPSMDARRVLQKEPNATPVMFQTWSNLLFLHWEWDPAEIQKTLPPGLYVDTYGAKACMTAAVFREFGFTRWIATRDWPSGWQRFSIPFLITARR